MWCSRVIAALVVAALLSGCEFRPLYATGGGGEVSRALALTRIEAIADRIGQKLRNFLLDRINPAGQPARPLYSLRVKTSVSRTDLGIERDETATRALLVLRAEYELSGVRGGGVLLSGAAQSTNSFNIVASDFATLHAERDALDRAAREISDAIKTRLGLHFSRAGPDR